MAGNGIAMSGCSYSASFILSIIKIKWAYSGCEEVHGSPEANIIAVTATWLACYGLKTGLLWTKSLLAQDALHISSTAAPSFNKKLPHSQMAALRDTGI